MMPPTSIDGTDITGATIDGQDVQEITVDGQTVFSAGPDIPDSAIHHFPMDEGSGSTLTDNVGSENGTINGPNWVQNNWVGSYALDYSPSNSADVTWSNSIIPSGDTTVLITVEAEWTNPADLNARILVDNVSDQIFRHNAPPDDYLWWVSSADGGIRHEPPSDNVKTRIALTHESGDREMYFDAVLQDSETISSGATGAASAVSMGTRDGNSQNPYNGLTDNLIICDEVLSQSEIQADYDSQPWS